MSRPIPRVPRPPISVALVRRAADFVSFIEDAANDGAVSAVRLDALYERDQNDRTVREEVLGLASALRRVSFATSPVSADAATLALLRAERRAAQVRMAEAEQAVETAKAALALAHVVRDEAEFRLAEAEGRDVE